MRILVTRPAEDAAALAKRLGAMGHAVICAPLLEIRFFDGPEISLDGVQAILATSANGVRGIARRTQRRDVPLFAVGPQTAEEAQRAGFVTIKNAQGDGEALVRTTREWASPDKGALLHAAGAEAPKFVARELEKSGFTVRRENLYEAVTAKRLPPDAASALANDELDAVLLFSPRSAQAFYDCVAAGKLTTHCKGLIACCISAAAAISLIQLNLREIRVAETPDQKALLALLA